ncbi:class I SAM-dependent methyltransferase, partial [Patescibacteria group bacterium]|nr:class I SAM-dependent methyltransferase [Patescibacteria group bacterium]
MLKNKLFYGQVDKCQICSNKKLEIILPFGHQPIVQEYLTAKQLHEPEMTYPLNLCRCEECGLLQLDYIVDPHLVFPKTYPYRTGLTNMLIRNFRALADELEKEYGIKKGDLIVDIGSNDGTLLAGFKEKRMRVLGVEPTDAAKTAVKNGIPTIQDYFDKQVAAKIVKKYGPAKIITATNVFAHINNVPALVRSIKMLMDKNSIFVSESQYLMDIFENLEFDTIYHEHLRFYSLRPLEYLFKKFGMTLIDARRLLAAGGSIRVFAMKGKHKQSSRVKELITAEEKAGIYDEATWNEFGQKVLAAKNALLEILIQCKKESSRIVGLTSSARSNALL